MNFNDLRQRYGKREMLTTSWTVNDLIDICEELLEDNVIDADEVNDAVILSAVLMCINDNFDKMGDINMGNVFRDAIVEATNLLCGRA